MNLAAPAGGGLDLDSVLGMNVSELAASHVSMVSHPEPTIEAIIAAANSI
jgi:hypothetical protein